ncbi:MAG: hypothetical protein IKS76_06130 [Paludibacteraceae bacterium]|nr:hypothetical protein [Paludibacteraceae bacterium]
MKKFFTFITAALMCAGMYAQEPEVKSVVLDFTDANWGIPTEYDKTEKSYTNGDYTITFSASSNGHKAMTKSKEDPSPTGVIFGKKNATLTLPALDFAVSKIVVTGLSDASGKVTTNIFVGDEAVSLEKTGSKEVNTFVITPEKRAAGNVFVLKITNDNNAQAAKIELFEDQGEPMPTVDTVGVSDARKLIDAGDSNPHFVRGVAAGSPFIFGSAEFKGNIVLWLTDEANAKDSLEAYYIAGKDNKPWESLAAAKEEIQSGDTILVYATKLKKYNSTYEIDPGYYVEMLGKFKEDPSIKYDTLTVAQAIEAAEALADNASSEKKVYVEGLTDHVQAYDVQNGNQIFFMYDEGAEGQDSVFQAYRSTPRKDGKAYPVLKGDKVRAFGFLKKYIDTKNGNAKILEIVEPTVEFLVEVPGDREIKTPALDTIDVAEALKIGAALADGGVSEKQYVIGGYVSSIMTYFDAEKKTETFWMADTKESTAASNADGAFEVYNGKPTPEEEMGLHARVYVTTKIKKYKPKSGDAIIETDGTPAVNVVEKGVIDVPEVVTVAQAIEIGATLSGTSEKRYEITGYVSAIQEAYSSFGNETFFITDKRGERTNDKTKAFYVYRGKPDTKKEIGFDAKIKIICKIKNYNGTIENDGTNVPFEVLEQGSFSVDTITVAEAVEKTKALAEGSQSLEIYAVKGYIAQISSEYDPGYGNMSFYMSDDQFANKSNFQCYRAKVAAADASRAVKGAFVIATGHLDNNSHGLQMYSGAEVFVGDAPHLDTLTVAKALEIGEALAEGASTDYYGIRGFVASIEAEYEDELQSFTMNDDKEATSGKFRAIDALIDEPGAQLHDDVLLIGKIEKVNGVIRVVKGHATVNPGQGIQNVVVTEKAQKIMVDGVLYIIRDNKIFNVTGTRVR